MGLSAFAKSDGMVFNRDQRGFKALIEGLKRKTYPERSDIMQSIGARIFTSILLVVFINFGALLHYLCFGDSNLNEAKWLFGKTAGYNINFTMLTSRFK